MDHHLASQTRHQTPNASQFYKGQFHNPEPIPANSFSNIAKIIGRYITEKRIDPMPSSQLPINMLTKAQLVQLDNNQLHVIKLGHSSILLKVYGEYWLLDPVFAERASPFSSFGPKRFHESPISLSALPPIDRVLISHNHYDHLDKQSVIELAKMNTQFMVPLGVGADLVKWGLKKNQIDEFDWWQEQNNGDTLIAFTPTRHFSGRALSDGNKTLWGSWVIKTPNESLYFSGDSGYFDGFKHIGKRYGPFDLTMIETGAYDKDWADVHMTPEQSIQAHIDLRGDIMMPIHNGTFDLAFHSWYEPLERAYGAAKSHNINLHTPIPGQVFSLHSENQNKLWWRKFVSDEARISLTAVAPTE